ncbi:MAG TPA: c-type cytochrome [Terriglobales bacterium]|nr:c-type cytochrome [Terriglobales bacterium]
MRIETEVAGVFVCLFFSFVVAQAGKNAETLQPVRHANVADGQRLYAANCAACHGEAGQGAPETTAGFQRPSSFPDFTRCDQTTAELDTAYKAVILHGGPYRGFSQIMPSFSGVFTVQQVGDLVAYLRTFCTNPHWPRGELNLPLALGTEKAYPEDEEVLTGRVNIQKSSGAEFHEIHEQRFGVKNQIEIDTPLMFERPQQNWYGGIGDITFGLKRVMLSSLRTGSILSLQGEVVAPTGNYLRGLGAGTTTFGTFAMFDQLFPTNTFIQFQGGGNLPVDTRKAPQNVFWNTAIGQSFAADHGLGRLWSPMVEFLASRDLVTGAKTDWNVLPEMQVTISHRQHIRGDVGISFPVNDTVGRPRQLMFYILWDWQDGKLTEGW